ncbi:MAG: glutathione S-transferase family protein [Acidobacteria bacterium]|nr:MAG: glutathione S-transferase family protein [Acidobacteriota bacterium]
MGLLVDGQWQDRWYNTSSTGGQYVRMESFFRGRVAADGSTGFRPASGRYHLYVSYACPWAHRALIYRALKGLEEHVSVSVVNPLMMENGWTFDDWPGVIPDPIGRVTYLHQIYTRAMPDYTGRVTVPVLWDRESETIVSNESAEIIRLFDREFDAVGVTGTHFCPPGLEAEIDTINEFIYTRINNGVYRAGFATTQEAYDEAVTGLFTALDEIEDRLTQSRYLLGNRITEADWRLFTTMVRFDSVYFGHFKCNVRRLVDYPNLWGWTRELYQMPGVATTVQFDHVKAHYYRSHSTINPTGVVPKGPIIDFTEPHGRGQEPIARG